MERVVNSVNQIVTECRNMIRQVSGCEYVDVRGLASLVETKCDELESLYNKHPDKEREISIKKTEVEDVALRLEYYMDGRLGLYTDRRKLRVMAERMYEDLTQVMYEKIGKGSGDEILMIATSMKWALTFLSRSKHIIFEQYPEDEKEIKLIIEIIKNEED